MEEVLLNIFFAYSREDGLLRNRLEKHLTGLKRQNYIHTWYDGEIQAGKEWENEIDFALAKADIILLLISADFIASDYCYEVEMRKAILRHERGDAVVIPVILHPCDWTDAPFSKIQCLPQNGKPVTDLFWNNQEIALSEVAKSIKLIVESLRNSKSKQLKAINEVLFEKNFELKITFEQLDDLKLDEEILSEQVNNLTVSKKNIELDIERLKISRQELESSFNYNQEKLSLILKDLQTQLNKERTNKTHLLEEIERLELIIHGLIIKKENLENEIKKIKI